MNLRFKKAAAVVGTICLSIASLAADKKADAFKPGPASSYKGHQKQGGFAIAAESYVTGQQAKQAFGKLNPYEEGVLPVLVLMQNEGKQSIDVSNLRFRYLAPDGKKADAIPAAEVKYLRAPSRPRVGPGPIPGINRKKKNPLAAEELEERAFTARMLPPRDATHGFIYFQVEHVAGAMLYVSGMKEAGSGNELIYMEIPIE
jgi:hypothetical protein